MPDLAFLGKQRGDASGMAKDLRSLPGIGARGSDFGRGNNPPVKRDSLVRRKLWKRFTWKSFKSTVK
jgi:hypothetical protein